MAGVRADVQRQARRAARGVHRDRPAERHGHLDDLARLVIVVGGGGRGNHGRTSHRGGIRRGDRDGQSAASRSTGVTQCSEGDRRPDRRVRGHPERRRRHMRRRAAEKLVYRVVPCDVVPDALTSRPAREIRAEVLGRRAVGRVGAQRVLVRRAVRKIEPDVFVIRLGFRSQRDRIGVLAPLQHRGGARERPGRRRQVGLRLGGGWERAGGAEEPAPPDRRAHGTRRPAGGGCTCIRRR